MMSSQADALKEGRTNSLARRPGIANGALGASRPNREHEGRKILPGAARIKVERIMADPDQPRKTFAVESLDRLAENMRTRGQLVPILVRWDADLDRYVIIDGERRYRAATQAGMPDLACVVENESDPDTILEFQLITNALRDEVAPVEQARAFERLIQSKGLTHRELGAMLGVSHRTIGNALDLLNTTPEIQAQVDSGEIPASTATLLSKIADPVEQQAAARRVVAEGLNRTEAAEVVAAVKPRSAPGKSKAKGKAKLTTSRKFKGPAGLVITAERSKGLDLLVLVESLRAFADQAEAEISQAN